MIRRYVVTADRAACDNWLLSGSDRITVTRQHDTPEGHAA